jgi:hypothetical protein
MSFGENNMKGRENRYKCKTKRKEGERTRKIGGREIRKRVK